MIQTGKVVKMVEMVKRYKIVKILKFVQITNSAKVSQNLYKIFHDIALKLISETKFEKTVGWMGGCM
jgi:hypothetical protein